MLFIQYYKGGDFDLGSYEDFSFWKVGFYYKGQGYLGIFGFGRYFFLDNCYFGFNFMFVYQFFDYLFGFQVLL